ncbi:MAG: lipid II flippase MurJ, partial [Pseudomonadota bacterium]
WAMLGLLYWGLRRMGDVVQVDDRYRRRLPRIALAAGIMGLVLWAAAALLKPALGTDTVRYAALLGLIGLATVSYFGAAHALGGMPLSDLRRAVRRG